MLVTFIRPTIGHCLGRTGRTLASARNASVLSSNYKLNDEWTKRFNDPLLAKLEPNKFFSDIMNKLNNGEKLYAIDLDMFINVAKPTVHLEESVYLLSKFRRSLRAHTMLPSTHHAVCRLFLDSDRLKALVDLLHRRVDYGIFPDHYTYNLMLNKAIENEDFLSGARIASLVMFQEEFGENKITDILSLYSLARYLESDKDFNAWKEEFGQGLAEILGDIATQSASTTGSAKTAAEGEKGQKEEDEEEEEDDDIEYVRVPFLKNDYFDDHFDLIEPQLICGKTLSMVANQFDDQCGHSARLLALSLHEKWPKLCDYLNSCVDSDIALSEAIVSRCRELIDGRNVDENFTEDTKYSLIDRLSKTKTTTGDLINMAQTKLSDVSLLESNDVQQARETIGSWSKLREQCLKDQMDKILRIKRVREIQEKRKQLKEKEQYLYFFENLRKKRITKIEYN